MEIIKKKISLEEFKSRVPGLIPNIGDNENSWGNIPYCVPINELFQKELIGVQLKEEVIYEYSFINTLYSLMMKNITNSDFYMYNSITETWIPYELEGIDEIFSLNFIGFKSDKDLKAKHKDIICIVTEKELSYILKCMKIFNDDIYRITENDDLKVNELSFIKGVKWFLQEIEVPNDKRGLLTPKYIFKSSINGYIEYMEKLEKLSSINCCYKNDYNNNGGENFKNWLKENNNGSIKELTDEERKKLEPCVTIPILLTSKIRDLGVSEIYYDDNLEDDELPIIPEENNKELSYSVEESKLQSLKKRKVSYDEEGNELPGIIEEGNVKLKTLYPSINVHYTKYEDGKKVEDFDDSANSGENYLRNIEIIDGVYYGDYIYNTEIRWSIKESSSFDSAQNGLIEEVRIYKEDNPIKGETKSEAYNKLYDIINKNIDSLKKETKGKLESKFKNDKDICYIIQDYEMYYKIQYNEIIKDENGDFIKKEVIEPYDKNGRIIYVIDSKIIFTYVLKGELFKDSDTDELKINELPTSPKSGIWYEDSYDMIPNKKIGGYVYDEILFEKKKKTYEFEGIDYTRRNITFADKSWHNYKNSKLNETNYFTFRDEKYNGISFPLKEKIDIVMDRGSASAFERQMKLLETKTFSDLKNYGNNYFNI